MLVLTILKNLDSAGSAGSIEKYESRAVDPRRYHGPMGGNGAVPCVPHAPMCTPSAFLCSTCALEVRKKAEWDQNQQSALPHAPGPTVTLRGDKKMTKKLNFELMTIE